MSARSLIAWMTAHPARMFLAAGLCSLLALLALPMLAWLPAGLLVLALLAGGPAMAAAAAAGAALPVLWAFAPVLGLGAGVGIAVAVLLPAGLAGVALAATRSLGFVFQAATLAACGLVLAIHALLGDPLGVLMPLVERLEPGLQQLAVTLAQLGIQQTPEELAAATARVAWATVAWMTLLHALLAQFIGLWAFGQMREPGLFGREFRSLRLGRVVAWVAIAAFLVSIGVQLVQGSSWQPADDLLFVLAAAFLLQALAVVHGLREAQAFGALPVVIAYVAVALLPLALVGLGFADTWVRFRERFGRRPGAAGG